MEFHAHASSSAGNLYTVTEDGAAPLMIECGLRLKEIQHALDYSVSTVAGCLVSHHHGDHARAVHHLVRAGIDVYASAPTVEALQLRSPRSVVVAAHARFEVGPWIVQGFDLRHDAEGVLGFLVLSPAGERLVYACDTAYVPYRFKKITIVALECNYSYEILQRNVGAGALAPEQRNRVVRNHMGLERVLDVLAANDLSDVREIHLLHLSDVNSDEAAFQAAIEQATGKPTHVAPRAAGAIAAQQRRGG